MCEREVIDLNIEIQKKSGVYERNQIMMGDARAEKKL